MRSRLRQAAERLTIYLPVILMGLLALGSYWLARNAPVAEEKAQARALRHEPDYFMRGFSVKTFDATGRLKSEVLGTEARHYPDTDTLEIDQVRIHSVNEKGMVTTATAKRALTNGDASEVQLFGDAVIVRNASTNPKGEPIPRLEFRGDFLYAFVDAERVKSHLPVTLTRGEDVFTADSMDYDNNDRVANLRGRVRGYLAPRAH